MGEPHHHIGHPMPSAVKARLCAERISRESILVPKVNMTLKGLYVVDVYACPGVTGWRWAAWNQEDWEAWIAAHPEYQLHQLELPGMPEPLP